MVYCARTARIVRNGCGQSGANGRDDMGSGILNRSSRVSKDAGFLWLIRPDELVLPGWVAVCVLSRRRTIHSEPWPAASSPSFARLPLPTPADSASDDPHRHAPLVGRHAARDGVPHGFRDPGGAPRPCSATGPGSGCLGAGRPIVGGSRCCGASATVWGAAEFRPSAAPPWV